MKQLMTIPHGTSLRGELRSKGKVKLEGTFEGGGLVEGTVLISREGAWAGNLVADIVIVEGEVKGNIVAKQKILLLSQAVVDGTVYSANIHMDEGASVTGKLQMNTPAPLGLQIDPANYIPVEEIMSDGSQERLGQQVSQAGEEIEQPIPADAINQVKPAAYKDAANVVVLQ